METLKNRIHNKIEYEAKKILQKYLNSIITESNREINKEYVEYFNNNDQDLDNYELNNEEKKIKDISDNHRNTCLKENINKYKNLEICIGIHIPPFSIAAISLFNNWIEGLNYMGIKAFNLGWTNEEIKETMNRYKPNIIITSHHDRYLENINLYLLNEYKKLNDCDIMFIVFDPHLYKTEIRKEKYMEAKKYGVENYICFWVDDAKDNFSEYYEEGFKVLSIPFSANPIKHYYAPKRKDLDYVFLGTGIGQYDKTTRYIKYFARIFKNDKYKGLINGPGWYMNSENIKSANHRYVYSKSKIGLNLHINDSINILSEINERTYILAACGTFQLIDNPKALNCLFPEGGIVTANNPKEYFEKFEYYLNNPKEKYVYIQKGIENIYNTKSTIFHRMSFLVDNIITYRGM